MKTSIAALAAILVSTAAAQTFHVAGTVVDSETAAPLGRTRVFLTGGPVPEQSVITTGDGKFSFDVPKGTYALLAAHSGFGATYGQTRSGSSYSSIVTGPDQDTTGIVMRWRAPIAIHGRVFDDLGEPVYDAKVELFGEAVAGGKKRVVSLGRAASDEQGNYSFSSYPGGTYYIAATGAPWYFTESNARQMLTEAGKPPVSYALTYFPSGNDPRAATPLVLHPGAELQADIALHPAIGSTLRFACPSSPCEGAVSLFAVGPAGVETLVEATIPTETIPAVLPGRYVARYTGPEGNMRKVIEVGGGDVTVEIIPKTVPTLTGKITLQNPEEQPRQPVYVTLLDEVTGQTFPTALDANGSFSFPAVPVSRVRLVLSGADGFFVTRMSVEGATEKDGAIEVVDGARVQVNLAVSGQNSRLKGFVMNGDKPVPAVMVILAPPAGSADPFSYHAFQTDSDGSFDFTAVPGGGYVLFATDDLELEYTNQETARPYLASGKRVRIEPHAVETENIGLTLAVHH